MYISCGQYVDTIHGRKLKSTKEVWPWVAICPYQLGSKVIGVWGWNHEYDTISLSVHIRKVGW